MEPKAADRNNKDPNKAKRRGMLGSGVPREMERSIMTTRSGVHTRSQG